MARTVKYAVLTATPDSRRGERVNVGVVVFCHDHIDVRINAGAQKLKALTGASWETELDEAADRIRSYFEPEKPAEALVAKIEFYEGAITASQLGWFTADYNSDYENAVGRIVKTLVAPPRKEKVAKQARLITEISWQLRRSDLLAKPTETISTGKVVRNFSVSPEEGLMADFALQNGRLYVASALDLRKQTAGLPEAALKTMVLVKSRDVYGDKAVRVGIYATDPTSEGNVISHIRMLSDYSDKTYNWSEPEGQWQFKKLLMDARPSIWPKD